MNVIQKLENIKKDLTIQEANDLAKCAIKIRLLKTQIFNNNFRSISEMRHTKTEENESERTRKKMKNLEIIAAESAFNALNT